MPHRCVFPTPRKTDSGAFEHQAQDALAAVGRDWIDVSSLVMNQRETGHVVKMLPRAGSTMRDTLRKTGRHLELSAEDAERVDRWGEGITVAEADMVVSAPDSTATAESLVSLGHLVWLWTPLSRTFQPYGDTHGLATQLAGTKLLVGEVTTTSPLMPMKLLQVERDMRVLLESKREEFVPSSHIPDWTPESTLSMIYVNGAMSPGLQSVTQLGDTLNRLDDSKEWLVTRGRVMVVYAKLVTPMSLAAQLRGVEDRMQHQLRGVEDRTQRQLRGVEDRVDGVQRQLRGVEDRMQRQLEEMRAMMQMLFQEVRSIRSNPQPPPPHPPPYRHPQLPSLQQYQYQPPHAQQQGWQQYQ